MSNLLSLTDKYHVIKVLKDNYNHILKDRGIEDLEVDPGGKLIITSKVDFNDFMVMLENTNYTNCKNVISITDNLGIKRFFNITDNLDNYLAIKTLQVLKSRIKNNPKNQVKSVFGKSYIKLENGNSIEIDYLDEVFSDSMAKIKLEDYRGLKDYKFHNLDIEIKLEDYKGSDI